MQALDFISASATGAPFGYGESISTTMNRIQRIGDRMDRRTDEGLSWPAVAQYYDPVIFAAIEGLRSIAEQIADDIPAHEAFWEGLLKERDRFV